MEDTAEIVRTTMGEIEKLLNSRTIVGEPIMMDGKTLIPLVSVGFAFGAGSGSGKMSARQAQEGTGGGTGGGGGVRPVAVIISDDAGVRIEPIKGGLSGAMERMAESVVQAFIKRREQKQEQGQEESHMQG